MWAAGTFIVGAALIILMFVWLDVSMAFILAPLAIIAGASYYVFGCARKGQ